MYLENPRASGGGEIIEHSVDERGRQLKIEYSTELFKTRVLQKRHFNFQNYNLTANESFDPTNFMIDCQTFVLRNFVDKEDLDVVKMYAENLVLMDNDTNDVDEIQKSRFIYDLLILLLLLLLLI